MAKFEIMIPFILAMESGVWVRKNETLEQLFARAKAKGIKREPADPGGDTLCGVTATTFKSYFGSRKLETMTYEDWVNIFRKMFWDKVKADNIKNQGIANLIVDWCWHSGVGVIKKIQTLLKVSPDGIIGPITLKAIEEWDADVLFLAIKNLRLKYYDTIIAKSIAAYERKIGRKATAAELIVHTSKRFERGWRNRVSYLQINRIFVPGCLDIKF